MTTERDHCAINPFLPMSCNGRSESFARSLHSRLRSLGSQDEPITPETNWSMSKQDSNSVTAHLEPSSYFDYNPPEITEDETDSSLCIFGIYPTNGNVDGSQINGSHECNGELYDEDDRTCGGKIGQDINENIVNHASESEVFEELEEINGLEVNGHNDISEITEEIVSNALDIADNPGYFSTGRDFALDYDNVLYITDPNEHTVEFQLLAQNLLKSSNTDDINEDYDENEVIPRVRRCSSLKTGKTPPGTPGRKKIVRFADVLGLDLADVRTYLDDIPKVPTSAYDDLLNVNINDTYCSVASKTQRILLALFRQPGGQPSFTEKVTINQVMLENAVVEDDVSFSIRGVVRVRNLDYDKLVQVRYSLDSWKSFSDLQAVYVENSSDGFTDKFGFLLYAYSLSIGQRLEFAVRFQSKGCQYWDNNYGANYCFQCLPASNLTAYSPVSIGMDDQIATFYYMEKCESDKNRKDAELTSTAVQDYIMTSLRKNANRETKQISKVEFLTVFVVLFLSIVFLYAKRALLF